MAYVKTPFVTGHFDRSCEDYKEVSIVALEINTRDRIIRITYERGNTVSGAWRPGRAGCEQLTIEGAAYDSAVANVVPAYAALAGEAMTRVVEACA